MLVSVEMRWQAPPPVFPVARRRWSAFEVAASLFVLAVAAHAAFILHRGVPLEYQRLAIVWLCGQLGAVGLVIYFWIERSSSSQQALRVAAVADLLTLAIGLIFPSAIAWSARTLDTNPLSYF
jgi:hypothetical protein